jgi:hypothetical protein
MSDDKKGLPFLFYDAALDAFGRAVHGATALAGGLIAPLPQKKPREGASAAAPDVATSETDTSAPALATALDEAARDALAEHSEGASKKKRAANIEAMTAESDDSPPRPEREAGPKPFKPQVGP